MTHPRSATSALLASLILATSLPLATAPDLRAQEARELQLAGGLALSFSPSQVGDDGPIQGGEGVGLSLLGEYVFAPAAWGGGRLYAGGPMRCGVGATR